MADIVTMRLLWVWVRTDSNRFALVLLIVTCSSVARKVSFDGRCAPDLIRLSDQRRIFRFLLKQLQCIVQQTFREAHSMRVQSALKLKRCLIMHWVITLVRSTALLLSRRRQCGK